MEQTTNIGIEQGQSGRPPHLEEKSVAPMASFLQISGVGSVKEQIKELEVRIAQKSEDMFEKTTTILKAGEILIGNESEIEALIGDVKTNITKVSSQVEKISTLHESLLKTRPLLETVGTALKMKQSEILKLKDEVQHLKEIDEENDSVRGKQLTTDMLMSDDSLFQVIKEIEKEKYELQTKCDNLQKELTESQLTNMKQVSRWRLENVQNLKACAELKQKLSQKCAETEELKTKCQLFEKQLLDRGKEELAKKDNTALSNLQNAEVIKADNIKLLQEKNNLQLLLKSKEATITMLQEKLAEIEAKVNALKAASTVDNKIIKSENCYNEHCLEKSNFANGHKNGFNENQTLRNLFTLIENKCDSEVTETFIKIYQQKLEDLQFENEKLHKEVLLYRSQITGIKTEQFSDSTCSELEAFRYETKKQSLLMKEIEQQIMSGANNQQENSIIHKGLSALKAAEFKIYILNKEIEKLKNDKEKCALIVSKLEKQLKALLFSDKEDIVSLVNEIEFKWNKLNDLVLFLEKKLHLYMDNVDINENKCITYFSETQTSLEATMENALVPYNIVEQNLNIVTVDELASDTTISHSQYYENTETFHDEDEAKSIVLSFQQDKNVLLQLDAINTPSEEVKQDKHDSLMQKEEHKSNQIKQTSIEHKPIVNITTRRFRGVLATKRRWFPCTTCGKKLTTKANLKTHLKLHSGERPFQCDICNKTFITKATLYTHRRIHTGDRPFECNICNKRFSSKSSLYMHQRIHTGVRPFKCNICKKAFVAKATLQNHQKIHSGERPYQCDLCMKSFTFMISLQLHRRIHTGEKPHSCDLCGKKFARGSSLHAHRKHHTGEKPYKCEFCEKAFIAFSNLAAHRRVHTGERPYRCNICAKTFASRGNLHVHVKIHSGEKPHKCDICMKAFSQRGALRDHKRIHTGEKPYTCETCGKKVATSSLLYSHRMTHSDKRPYQCNICLKTYKTNTNLQEHKRIHTGERPYNCNICGKTFAAKSSLYTHKITHTGERPFNCSICGKSFATKSTLYTHKMIHTGERPYQCNVCGKNLASKSSLYTHNMIHTGEKPYECDICMKRFRQLGNLQAHRNIHLPD